MVLFQKPSSLLVLLRGSDIYRKKLPVEVQMIYIYICFYMYEKNGIYLFSSPSSGRVGAVAFSDMTSFLVGWFFLTLTSARMGSQRQPKRLQRTHKTWAMCHLSGPEIWECG